MRIKLRKKKKEAAVWCRILNFRNYPMGARKFVGIARFDGDSSSRFYLNHDYDTPVESYDVTKASLEYADE